MRAISLVNKIEFEFAGNVVRNALTLGDVDNDGCSELVVGNSAGEVAIFKGKERVQTIPKLSFVTCVAVGDVLNQGRNSLVIVTADGWVYIYEKPYTKDDTERKLESEQGTDEADGQTHSSTNTETLSSSESTGTADRKSVKDDKKPGFLVCIHIQRIPANAKNILIGDVDSDGANEMVLGLTDRVVRSYRWLSNPNKPSVNIVDTNPNFEPADKLLGKFVALNKWECANQIGSITLHHSWDGTPSLLIAQPGGTFMRIRCSSDLGQQDSESRSSSSETENIPGSVDYQFLGISRMRNQNISTEILGDLRQANESFDSKSNDSKQTESTSKCVKGRPYAVATLDGTIMLVQDEVILWAIAVDHQIFTLTKLDITGNGSDDIVVCSWDGQTYILDQQKNSVRFHLEDPVQAFDCGWYNLDPEKPDVTALVYVTFKNKIIVYYDIPLRDMICKRFEPDVETISELFIDENRNAEQALQYVKDMDRKTKCELVEYLLYNVKS